MPVQVLGVYAVEEAPEPCHLVELAVRSEQRFDIAQVTQEQTGSSPSEWQVPYDERLLDDEGGEAGEWPGKIAGNVRVVFFFHYLAFDRPLLTPEGAISVPQPQERPARLAFMAYEPPC